MAPEVLGGAFYERRREERWRMILRQFRRAVRCADRHSNYARLPTTLAVAQRFLLGLDQTVDRDGGLWPGDLFGDHSWS